MDIKKIIQQNRGQNKEDFMDLDTLTSIIEGIISKILNNKKDDIDRQFSKTKDEITFEMTDWSKKMKSSIEKIAEDYIKSKNVLVVHGKTPIKGVDYEDGYTPVKGKDYFDGYTPKKNKDYFDGKDAVVDYKLITELVLKEVGSLKEKPDQIVEKINIAKEKVKMSSVNGLLEKLQEIKDVVMNNRPMPKAGGGMGIWVHQQFSLTSATSSLTLSNSVAAGGTAHIFRYQGQVLAMNVDYTVSGKVVSLLFTPIDGTVFDATYIRS